ncbi:hypothetical protein FOZ62_022784 [Perkinsus olseni]|uniref:Ubiquitinyl hydrolase 1 n=1 Tax=Perkinsus olseni TaxID=32597 RepID=A0A7J6R7X2_PEROL|nr:hypothetical protein FOZ62_022784 [Perkinsus olseni]
MGNAIACGVKERYTQPVTNEENDPLRSGVGATGPAVASPSQGDTPGWQLVDDDVSLRDAEEVRSEGGSLLPRPDVDDTPAEAKFMACDTQESLRLRARYEAEFVRKYDTVRLPQGDTYYIVSTKWINSWKHFISEGKGLPGPISNNVLFRDDLKTLLPRLVRSRDYRGINQRIWSFWLARYGGGPLVTRLTLDIYDHTGESPCGDLRRIAEPGSTLTNSAPSPAAIDITTKPVGIKNLGSSSIVRAALDQHQQQIEDEDVNSANKASSTSSSSSAAASNAPSCEHTALYEPQNGYGEIAAAMVDLFNKCQVNVEDLTTDTKPAVNPVRLLSALKRKYPKNPLFMDLAEEQDCHEFLSVLLDALHGCTHDSVKPDAHQESGSSSDMNHHPLPSSSVSSTSSASRGSTPSFSDQPQQRQGPRDRTAKSAHVPATSKPPADSSRSDRRKRSLPPMRHPPRRPSDESVIRWREYRSRNPSLITDMFSGMFRSRFMCHSCGHVTKVYEPIMDLSLPVPSEPGPEMATTPGCSAAFRPSASAPSLVSADSQRVRQNNTTNHGGGSVSLKKLIANYFVDEELTDFSCEKCHCKCTKATKSTKVTASPDILVIHLRRFTAQGRKINTAVSFPMECAKLVDRATSASSTTAGAAQPCLEGSCSFQPYLDGAYRLLGLCVHIGTHLGTGHYVSYVRRKAAGGGARWWRCDDEKVSLIDPDKVLAKQSQVYCLFFQKCSGPSNLPIPHSGYSLSNYVPPRPMTAGSSDDDAPCRTLP